MHQDTERKELDLDPLDVSNGLYHEGQGDGVPYDEDLEAFTRDLQKTDDFRS